MRYFLRAVTEQPSHALLFFLNNSKLLAHALLMSHYYVYETACEKVIDLRTILTSTRRKK